MSWQDDPVVEPASADSGAAAGDWWKSDPVHKEPMSLGTKTKRVIGQAAQGFNDTVADIAGAPVDAANWVAEKMGAQPRFAERVLSSTGIPITGSAGMKKNLDYVATLPGRVGDAFSQGSLAPFKEDRTSRFEPEGTAEHIAKSAGEGAAAMMVPGLGAEALLAKSMQEAASFSASLSKIIAGAGPASNAAIGAAGGALGEVAAEAVPPGENVQAGPLDFSRDALRETARLGGNIAGGGVAAGVTSGVEAAGRAVGSAVRAATEPAELRAARTIMGRADDPAVLRQAAQEAADAPALVEGSRPTTFQATGDLGVGGLEREVAASQKGVPRFAAVREEQNSARLAELENLQKSLPENADAADVAAAVQKRVQELEMTFGERVTAARNQLDEAFKAGQLNEAEYGAALREAPIRLRTQLEQTEDALWGAVDPDRVTPFNPQNLKAGVEAIEGAIPRTAKAAEGEERALFDVFKGLDENTTFGEITALRSRLTDELRDPTNKPTVRRRLTLMLGEVDRALGETGAMAPEVTERYAAARAATRDVKERFGEGAVGRTLKEGENDGFRMTASNVAKNIFDRPEDLRAYLTAVGDDAAARAALEDYAAFSLRKAAVRDGMMSQSKYQQWVTDHDYVLKEFPDLAKRFENIRSAQATLDGALASQKQALADYQTGAVKRLLNTQDPEPVITNALKRPGEFEALAKEVSGDPAAKAGMKRAVIEFMLKQARSTAEAGTSGEPQINAATLQKFFINNRRSLAALFEPDELASIDAVVRDLQRANRSIVAVRIPGGSNTAQDTGARSILETAIRQRGGRIGGVLMDPTGGVAGYVVGGLVDALRVARSETIEKALVEMMLSPKMAADWLKKVPATNAEATASAFARRLKALTADQVTRAIDDEGRRDAPLR